MIRQSLFPPRLLLPLQRLWLLAPLLLAACSSVPRDSGFDTVSESVMTRSGKQVHWYQGGPEDRQVTERLRGMLATPLNPNKAVQIALLNNRRLQATYEELGIAQANLVQAGLLKNPIFHGAALYASGGGSPELDFGVALDFMTIFSLPLRRKLAEAQFETAKLQVTLAVMALAGDVYTACYRLQSAQQTLELLQEVDEGLLASLDVTRQLHDAGNITDLALHNEQAQYFEAKLGLAAAELAVLEAREALNALLGLWGEDTGWTFATRLPEIPQAKLDLSAIEKQVLGTSLDLAIIRSRLLTSARQASLVGATRLLAEFEIGASAERSEGEWERGPSLGFALPLFDQGQARQAAVISQLRRQQEEYKALAIDIRAAARRASLNLQLARKRATYLREVILPLREQIVRETLLNYNAMQLGVLQLLQAQRQQVLSARQYLDALRDYWLTRVQVEQLLNGRFAGMSITATPVDTSALTGGDDGGH